VFFGDSITVGLATSNVASKSENFGINGDTIDGLLLRVPHYKLDGARMIVVAIGVNNWEKDRLAKFGEKYEKLLQLFPQSVPVIVSAILPVNTHSKAYPMLANARPAILGANRDIALVCGRHAKCQFVDISSKLTMPSGDLAPRYDVGDGVHISSDAYQVWTQALSTLISSVPSKD
jgi:lysophospholipase L1-like esterase